MINRGYRYFENSTIMLLNILKRINPKKITLAGFDGFNAETVTNYSDNSYQNERYIDEFETLNKEITEMLNEIKETMYSDCQIDFLTPSIYEGYRLTDLLQIHWLLVKNIVLLLRKPVVAMYAPISRPEVAV